MESEYSCDQVIVVPRNGYANRLQAWASAAVLAERLQAQLRVCWESEPVASTPAEHLFSREVLESNFVESAYVTQRIGAQHSELPRYLTVLPSSRAIVLAGHDRGEQGYMDELDALMRSAIKPSTLVIIAGGAFHLPGTPWPQRARGSFYRDLTWSQIVDERFDTAVDSQPDFAGLHVRQTDRSREAPTERTVFKGLTSLLARVPERSLFVCADSDAARRQWGVRAEQLGFSPWSMEGVEFDRTSRDNGVSALVDWRLLAHARGIVHPAASTFSSEAVVAAGTAGTSVALTAGPLITAGRQLRETLDTVLSYPTRRRLKGQP